MKLAEASVLIVSSHREDRRVLFDTLDRAEVEAIYTAKSVAQASDFISQIAISLMIADLALDAKKMLPALADFRKRNASGVVLAILPPEGSNVPGLKGLLRHVDDVLQSPVSSEEFEFRLGRTLQGPAPKDAEKRAPAPPPGLGLLRDADMEYLLVDAMDGRVIEVNEAFVTVNGQTAAKWSRSQLDDLPLSWSREQRKILLDTLRREGHASVVTERIGAGGSREPVEVSQYLAALSGRPVYVTSLRPFTDHGHVGDRLASLGRLLPEPGNNSGSLTVADLVGESLDLDYFLAVGLQRDDSDPLAVLAAYGRGELNHQLVDPERHQPYGRILEGEWVLIEADASLQMPDDPFLSQNSISSYLGLPLRHSAGEVSGALIAASRKPVKDFQSAVHVLRAVASLLSQKHEIRSLRRQREELGLHDSLTQLPNRLLFNDRVNHALREAARTGEMFSLLFVDLDRFKTINDSLGHDVGDQVLIGVAERLQHAIRGSDTVARYAGDEFTVILRHIVQKEDVMRVAQKINKVLALPLPVGDEHQELQITASIGVSYFPDDGTDLEVLLKHADIAMYSAKGLGRNTCQAYVEQPQESHQQKLVLESKLRQAEQNQELRVFFQPQVSAATEDIIGMEALIRWEHPELGLISPGFFIPLAEETGLIVPIGEWLLNHSCALTRQWQDRFNLPLALSVNLSPLQLRQPNLLEVVDRALTQTELHPGCLDLEVTESLSIKSIPGLAENLQALRDLGCQISIDDFGTGQSSLDYLKRFPADRLKIDQSFVRNIGVDPDDEAIVQATIEMAHRLNMQVVAEGVEEEDHLDFLVDHSCDVLQGFLFCRPLPADSFSAMLMEREALMGGEKSVDM